MEDSLYIHIHILTSINKQKQIVVWIYLMMSDGYWNSMPSKNHINYHESSVNNCRYYLYRSWKNLRSALPISFIDSSILWHNIFVKLWRIQAVEDPFLIERMKVKFINRHEIRPVIGYLIPAKRYMLVVCRSSDSSKIQWGKRVFWGQLCINSTKPKSQKKRKF